MLGQLSSLQIAEWEAFFKLNPPLQDKHDFELGYILSVITNLFIGAHGKKGSTLTKPDDYMIKWGMYDHEPKKQSIDEMRDVLLGIAKRNNERLKKSELKNAKLLKKK